MMAGPSNTVLLGPNTLSQNLKMQLYTPQDDPFPFPFHMDHPDKITFWPITLKLTELIDHDSEIIYIKY